MFPDRNLYVSLVKGTKTTSHATFDMKFTHGVWRYIGISYSRTGTIIGYMDGVAPESQEKRVGTGIVPDTTSSQVLFGKRDNIGLNGAISCAMLFNATLTLDDMKRARIFCTEKNTIRKGR
jgi:hypothetical protein